MKKLLLLFGLILLFSCDDSLSQISRVGGNIQVNQPTYISSPWDIFNQSNASWWRSRTGVTTSGNNVTSVTDQGGMSRNLTGTSGAQPTLGTDNFGIPYFNFTNSSFDLSLLNYETGTNDFQIIVVFQSMDTEIPGTSEKRFFNMQNGTRIAAGYNVDGQSMPPEYAMASNVSAFNKSKQGHIPGRLHVIRYDFTEPSQRIFINGINDNVSSTAYTKQALTSALVGSIGRAAGGSTLNIVGRLYEVMIVKGTYTDADKARVDQYFLNLYRAYDKTSFQSNNKTITKYSESKILDLAGQPTTDDYIFSVNCSLDENERLHITYTRGENHNNNSNQKIIYRYSDDYGATMSPEQVLKTANANTRYNPSQCIRTKTGRLILSYTTINYEPLPRTFSANAFYSDDNGSTWSYITGDGAEGLITNRYTAPGYVVGVGNMIVYEDNTILHALYGTPDGAGNREVMLFKSVNDGMTFTYVSQIAPITVRDYEETHLIKGRGELLIALMRSDPPENCYLTYSWDKGVNWVFQGSISDRPVAYQSVGYNGGDCSPSGGIFTFGRSTLATGYVTKAQYSSDGGYTYTSTNNSARTGAYMYGNAQWSRVLQRFVGIHGEENEGTVSGLGPCSLYATQYVEVQNSFEFVGILLILVIGGTYRSRRGKEKFFGETELNEYKTTA